MFTTFAPSPAAATYDPDDFVTITHTPPTETVAGDGLSLTATFEYHCNLLVECTNARQRLVYFLADGTTQSTERVIADPELTPVDVWNVTLPGNAVRFPEAQYFFEVLIDAYHICCDNTQTYSDRSPLSGEHTVTATPTVRLNFQKPDGTAAANLPVEIAGATKDAYWRSTTDAVGRLNFTLPVSNPWIQEVITSGERQATLRVLVSSATPPTGNPAPGEPVHVDALGAVVAVQVNLGRIELDAVDRLTQDETFVLGDLGNSYYHPADFSAMGGETDPDCTNYYFGSDRMRHCKYKWDLGVHDVRVSENLGGSDDIQGRYEYTNNVRTISTRSIQIKYGQWVESKGKTTAEKTREVTARTEWIGPNDARDFVVPIIFVMDEEYNCYYSDGNSQPDFCNNYRDVHQADWGGGIKYGLPSSSNQFNKACDPNIDDTCSDWTEQMGAEWDGKLASSSGHDVTYQVSLTWTVVQLTASSAHSHHSTSTTEVDFKKVSSTKTYQFVYVPLGAKTGHTPANAPDRTFTTSSDSNLTNYIARPGDGCPTCIIPSD